MSTTPINPESISLEELKRLANEQLAGGAQLPTVEENMEQAVTRDPETGRFVSTKAADAPQGEAIPEVSTVVPEPETEEITTNDVVYNGELVYRLETDGEEVYYGHGADAITRERDAYRQLRDAKVHANRKIREQNTQLKEITSRTEQLSADDRFVLSERLKTEPDKAIAELIEKRLNADPRIQAGEKLMQQQQINAVTTQWVEANPEFHADKRNGNLMWQQMRLNGAGPVPTISDMDTAYRSLRDAGLLSAKPPVQAVPAVPIQAVPARRSSGTTPRSTVATPPPIVEDPYRISMADLRAKAEKAMREAAARGEVLL